MSDYGHPITLGLSLTPSVHALEDNLRLAQADDEAGLDYLAIQDHAYNAEFLDVWTLISFLAARTERIAFVPERRRSAAPSPDHAREGRGIAEYSGDGPDRPGCRRGERRPMASPRWVANGAARAT
jgi:hypothetical protein